MIEKIGVFMIGLGLCGLTVLETVKYVHHRQYLKHNVIDPDFDWDDEIVFK